MDAQLAERLQAEEFELHAEPVAGTRPPGPTVSMSQRVQRRARHARGEPNVPTGPPGTPTPPDATAAAAPWDLLWDAFPREELQGPVMDFGHSRHHQHQHQQALRGLQALEQRRAELLQQQQQHQQRRRRRQSPSPGPQAGQQPQHQPHGPHFVSPFPGLVIMQQPSPQAGPRADTLGLLGELFGHQHVRDPAALFELLGELEPVSRGLDPAVVDASTTTMTYEVAAADRGGGSDAGGLAQNQCSVCLEHFKSGEELRMLPCMHRYHKDCIDRWLARSPACPVCKHEIAH